MSKHTVMKGDAWYSIKNGEVYCNEWCFNELLSQAPSLDYTVWCVMCGANGREISTCPSATQCELVYRIVSV